MKIAAGLALMAAGWCRAQSSPAAPASAPASAAAGASAPPVFKEHEITTPPRLLHRVEPEYPAEAAREGRHGRVFVEILVNERGEVERARVLQSEDRAFDEAALAAIRQWRYSPPLDHGKPVKAYRTATLVFALPPGAAGSGR